jgi:hypothetical protein
MGGDKDLHHLDKIGNMCHIIRTLKTTTNLNTIRYETKVDLNLLSPPMFPSNILLLRECRAFEREKGIELSRVHACN